MSSESVSASSRPATPTSLSHRPISDAERAGLDSHHQRIIESVGLILWEYSRRERRFTFVSPQAEDALGYSVEQWLEPEFWYNALHPHDREWAKAFSHEHVDRGANHEFEYRMVGPDGRIAWFKDMTTVASGEGADVTLQGVLINITDRKRVEDELRQSEQRLQTVAENLPGVVYSYERPVTGPRRLIYVGPGLESILGPNGAAAVQKNFDSLFDLVHPDDQPRLDSAVQRSLETLSIASAECRLRHESGRYVWVRSASRPVRLSDDVLRWHVLLIDIDEEKRAQIILETLTRQTSGVVGEAFFASVVESVARACEISSVAICEPDPAGHGRWRSRAFWNHDRLSDNVDFAIKETLWAAVMNGETIRITANDSPSLCADALFCAAGARAARGYPLYDSNGEVIGMLALLHDEDIGEWIDQLFAIQLVASRASAELQRLRLGAVLNRSESNLRMMIEQMPAVIWTTDAQLVLTSSAGLGLRDLGLTPGQTNGISCYDFFQDDEGGRRAIKMHELARSGESVNYDNTFGNRRYQCHIEPLRDADGAIIGTVGVALDITEQQRAVQRAELMMRELDHRVRNNLSALISIASQIAAGTDSVPDFLDALTGRITAMARAYDAIAESRTQNVSWRRMLMRLLAPHDESGTDCRVQLDGPQISLPTVVAFPLSLVVHELAVNAAKHGALTCDGGRVEIDWTLGDNHMLTVDWREYCRSPVAPPLESGFGTSVIEGIIRHQLHGSVQCSYEPFGLRAKLSVPLDRIDGSGETTNATQSQA